MRHLIVTGGGGYIGGRVVRRALAQGWAVTALSRSRRGVPVGARHVVWGLGEGLPADVGDAQGAAVIHLAHDWGVRAEANAAGTQALLAGCRAAGVGRFVFVSSQSARADAANIYGRVKWGIEQILDRDGEVSARVGLVYGGPVQAMFGLLCKLTGMTPVLPMIDPWRKVQPIHIDEVAEGLLRLAERGGRGWVGLAAAEGVAFGTFLKVLAREFHGRGLMVLPVPVRFALLACDVSARIPFFPTVDRERVLGLAGTRAMACGAHLAALGLEVAPIEVGLRREVGSRRAILAEGRGLLRYVLGAAPGVDLLRRYVRAVGGGGAVARPWGALRVMEAFAGPVLAGRLDLALALAEASPEGERALMAGSRFGRLARLSLGLVVDGVMLPVRVAAAWWRRG